MMFTRLGRSISQSYRSRNVFGGGNGGRSQTSTRSSVYKSRYISDKLGVLKRYFGSVAANNGRNGSGVSSKVYTSDTNSILANPRIPRFFSSEAPNKEDDDIFHSNEMIETPMGNNQKFESKERKRRRRKNDKRPAHRRRRLLLSAMSPFGDGGGRTSTSVGMAPLVLVWDCQPERKFRH